jgi:hypothetical protein
MDKLYSLLAWVIILLLVLVFMAHLAFVENRTVSEKDIEKVNVIGKFQHSLFNLIVVTQKSFLLN